MNSEQLNDIERRCVKINVRLNRIKEALERGNRERAMNLWEEARELNLSNRRDLLALGAVNSTLADRELTEMPPDDDDLIGEEELDLKRMSNLSVPPIVPWPKREE